MSRIDELVNSYRNHIGLKWRDKSPLERVIFCVYNEGDELRLRNKLGEFELATIQTGHTWHAIDLTDRFGSWIAKQRYAENYFKDPEAVSTVYHKFLDSVVEDCADFLGSRSVDSNGVVALYGVGSLFGIVRVKEVVDRVAPLVPGRLLVFFPGTFERNTYRLLDGYDGWNYLAVPIT